MRSTNPRTENAAELAAFLMRRGEGGVAVPGRVLELQRIARRLHHIDERHCNEDLGCPKCQGAGSLPAKVVPRPHNRSDIEAEPRRACRACAGRGVTTGRTEERLEATARSIAEAYRCRLYVQGDCRGWPLYLIPEESGPAEEDAGYYNGRGVAVCPH